MTHEEETTVTDPNEPQDRDKPERRYCGGPKRQSEGTCTRPAGWGTSHPGIGRCKLHGGSTPSHVAKAEKQLREARLRNALALAYGDDVPDIEPAEAMLRAVSWKYAEVLALRIEVAALEREEMVWGTTRVKEGGDDRGTTEEARPNIWWQMLRTAEEQLVKFAAAARSAGCDERRLQLAEQQGQMLAGVIRRILERLGLTEDQQALVVTVVPEELRSIDTEVIRA